MAFFYIKSFIGLLRIIEKMDFFNDKKPEKEYRR